MSAKIDITANDQDTANAITAAVHNGLVTAGFTSVSTTSEVVEPDTLLNELRNRAPALFDTPVEINAVAIEEAEDLVDTDDDESTEEVVLG